MTDTYTSDQYKKARRAALWMLYGMDVANLWSARAMEQSRLTAAELEPEIDVLWPAVAERVEGVLAMRITLDEQIQRVSPRWKVDRMAYVDRNILRLGAWELLDQEIAPIIVINACVELAKEFGDKTTPGFINGLLDQFCKNHKITIS